MATPAVIRGVATGAVLFVLSATLAWVRGRLLVGASAIQAATVVVTAIVFVLYGIALDLALGGNSKSGRAGPA
jgi:hypothetical protein